MWVQRHAGLLLCPTDVEIADDGNGTMRVLGPWTTGVATTPHVAVAASTNGAVAVASAAPVTLHLSADGAPEPAISPAPARRLRAHDGDETISIGLY